MKDYTKPSVARKPDMIILQIKASDLKSNKDPSDITNEMVELAKNIKSN